MKKLGITVLIVSISLLVIPWNGFSLKIGDEVRVTENRVRLRFQPSIKSEIIHHFKANDVVVIFQKWKKERIGKFGKHYWYRVQYLGKDYKSQTGWVYGAFLSKVLSNIVLTNGSRLYPIGWSRDGKFAYILDHPITLACEGECTLCIRDLRKNKTLYLDSDCHQGITKYWLKNKSKTLKKFKGQLKKYKIHVSPHFSMGYFPVKVKKKRFDVTTKHKTRKKTLHGEELEYVSQVSVYFITNRKSKLLYRETFKDPYQAPYSGIVGFAEGYFKSPYENRIAIIQTGYYSDENYEFVFIIGTVLK